MDSICALYTESEREKSRMAQAHRPLTLLKKKQGQVVHQWLSFYGYLRCTFVGYISVLLSCS